MDVPLNACLARVRRVASAVESHGEAAAALGGLGEAGVEAEEALGYPRSRATPGGAARIQLLRRDLQIQAAAGDVHRDGVSVADEGNRTAERCFRRHLAD